MYSIIFIYVSLIGNGTSQKSPPTKNSSNLRNIGRGGGWIILHGLEYLIRHEVVFCFIF